MGFVVNSIMVCAIIFFYWRFFYFWRDPHRIIPTGNNVVSPADGTVVYVKKVKKNTVPIATKKNRTMQLKELTKMKDIDNKNKMLIGIFMHPTSCHVNRAPIQGKVTHQHHHQSINFPMTKTWVRTLLHLKPRYQTAGYLLENERITTIIKGTITLAIIQIADIYVNKIDLYVKKGQTVSKGQRIGMIKLGSQVDLILPDQKNINILVKEGHKVIAGESVLAALK